MTIYGNSRQCLSMWFNQHLTVLSQHIFVIILHPVFVTGIRQCSWCICLSTFLICVVVALILGFIAFAVLDADIEFAILLVCAIYITYIATTEYVTILTCQLFYCTYSATMHMHLCLSEHITIGVECTTFTKVVVASTTTKHITMNLSFV